MRKSLFFTVLLAVISFNAIAQDAARQNLTSPGMIYAFDMNNNSVVGTPYIIDKFMPGKISFDKEGKVYNIRYNAFSDVMELEKNDGNIEAINRDLVNVAITFSNSGKTYQAYNYIEVNTNEAKRGYFVIATNAAQKKPLLIKERIVFIEKQAAKNGYSSSKPPKYKRKGDEFYTLNDNGIAVELSTKKKDLAKMFPEHSKSILSYIKSNKIKTSKQEDLAELMNYINTL